MRLRRRRRIVCQQAVELMTAYLEDTLPPADRARLEHHLDSCPHCTEYLAQLKATITALGHVDHQDVDGRALDELVTIYRRWQAGT